MLQKNSNKGKWDKIKKRLIKRVINVSNNYQNTFCVPRATSTYKEYIAIKWHKIVCLLYNFKWNSKNPRIICNKDLNIVKVFEFIVVMLYTCGPSMAGIKWVGTWGDSVSELNLGIFTCIGRVLVLLFSLALLWLCRAMPYKCVVFTW